MARERFTAKGISRLLDDGQITHHDGWNFLLAKQNLETWLVAVNPTNVMI